MSTHFIVPEIAMLHTVTDPSPGIGVDTANGPSYGVWTLSCTGVVRRALLLGSSQ